MTEDLLNRGFMLGQVRVEPQRQRIIRNGDAVHMEPRVMRVLVELALHSGSPVSRAELLDAVWADVVVGDEVLSRAISILRQALGDERTDPRFIRTIPRQGYELIVPAVPIADLPMHLSSRWFSVAVGVAAVLLFVAGWLLWPPQTDPRVLVLMPIKPDVEELGGVAAGISDELYGLVSRSDNLESLARRWSFGLRDTSLPPQGIAEQFGANYLLEGALGRSGDELQLYLEMIELPRGASVWWREISAPNARRLADLAVSATRTALNEQLAANIGDLPAPAGGVDEGAYQAYLAARHHWSLRGAEHISRAAQLLQQAIEIDPDFAAARLALAQVYALEPFYSAADVQTGFTNARRQLALALDVDPQLRYEANALEGFMRLRSRDWNGAREILRGTLEQDPDNALAHYWYAMLLSALGESAAGLQHALRAVELEPTSPVVRDRLAINYLWENDTAAAGLSFADAKRLGYTEGIQSKAYIVYLIRSGRLEELSAVLQRWGMPGAWVRQLREGLAAGVPDPELIAATERAIAAGDIPAELIFGTWVILQQPERAIEAFDYSLKSPDVELIWSAEAEILRRSADFEALLARLGLVEFSKKSL